MTRLPSKSPASLLPPSRRSYPLPGGVAGRLPRRVPRYAVSLICYGPTRISGRTWLKINVLGEYNAFVRQPDES